MSMLAYLIYLLRWFWWWPRNALRRLGKPPQFITFILEGDYPELREPPRSFLMRQLRAPRTSLEDVKEWFEAVAHDPRVRGVVIQLRPLEMGLAQLDTLRQMFHRLQDAGKEVIVWSYVYDTRSYYVASAADRILLVPEGMINPLGIYRRYLFLAEALDRLGLKGDFLPISPYKSAADTFTREDMSDEVREMSEWLIDAAYGQVIQAIANGRGIDQESARQLINSTPCLDYQAKELQVVDEVLNEEEIPAYLKTGEMLPRLDSWENSEKMLLRPAPTRPGKYIALIAIEGTIIDGESQRPPVDPPLEIPFFDEQRAGDLSVVQAARQVMEDKRAAAVVVYINSRGGSPTASENMRAALAQLARKKPLVIAMGAAAASGGYWVATAGKIIFAYPSTLTGSIGVIIGKIVNTGLLDKLSIHTETLSRGDNALLYDYQQPFDEEQRATMQDILEQLYAKFVKLVAESRGMNREQVEEIAAGRVWTGSQALERGLVDELGGLEAALGKARELGGLTQDAKVRRYTPGKQPIAPLSEPASTAWVYYWKGVQTFNNSGLLLLAPLVWQKGL